MTKKQLTPRQRAAIRKKKESKMIAYSLTIIKEANDLKKQKK